MLLVGLQERHQACYKLASIICNGSL